MMRFEAETNGFVGSGMVVEIDPSGKRRILSTGWTIAKAKQIAADLNARETNIEAANKGKV